MSFLLFRRRHILPGSRPPSTFCVKELNYCVRNGNRCDLLTIITGEAWRFTLYHAFAFLKGFAFRRDSTSIIKTLSLFCDFSPSTGFRHIYIKPFGIIPLFVSKTEREIVRSVNSHSLLTYLTSNQFYFRSSPRPISISQLNMLPYLHLWPINHIVYVGSY